MAVIFYILSKNYTKQNSKLSPKIRIKGLKTGIYRPN